MTKRNRVTINTRCIANNYAAKPDEAIAEISDPETGINCLLSVRRDDSRSLRIQAYRYDDCRAEPIEGGVRLILPRVARDDLRDAAATLRNLSHAVADLVKTGGNSDLQLAHEQALKAANQAFDIAHRLTMETTIAKS